MQPTEDLKLPNLTPTALMNQGKEFQRNQVSV